MGEYAIGELIMFPVQIGSIDPECFMLLGTEFCLRIELNNSDELDYLLRE